MTIGATEETMAITRTPNPFVLTLLTTPGSETLRIENRELPAAIQVDETKNREVARFLGAGVQVYDCLGGVFKFREPQANLYDLDTLAQRVIHFATEPTRPNWADADGSRVVGNADPNSIVAVNAPPPFDPTKDVKWLRVPVFAKFGKGLFGNITFIQRVLTFGGQAPASCVADEVASVPYTALYIFWAPR
ncbi:MAG TPA: DUF3455 domain-containing protein [Pseudonocardiaceae bacterium]|nr:DUF3455 domain-containing protein [Pseudonocardiaceae bacterium]